MFKLINRFFIFCFAPLAVFAFSGCEKKHVPLKENDAMVGYAQDLAQRQAKLASKEQLKDQGSEGNIKKDNK
ncbi:hypothetical protein [Acinetobacter seifertii]|uniref:hypothetical protein n=1 Tax=Acinetobacter seifertii TaxID=1530123 RepID=UPI000C1E17B9|nr:hypothetical protein [Acinetobacter seifertii]PJF03078.1 hypothetical protein CVD06_13710 [Acinetobacter seifertii]PJG72122.1 hypothetical protein CVD08_01255 [Acinetobacter seifertii]